MYKMKRISSSTDPCGTPWLTLVYEEYKVININKMESVLLLTEPPHCVLDSIDILQYVINCIKDSTDVQQFRD